MNYDWSMRPNEFIAFSKPSRSQANHFSDSNKETDIMQELKDPTFKTENLNVFRLSIKPHEGAITRDYYLAFANHFDFHPIVQAIATVEPKGVAYSDIETLFQIQLCSHQGSIEYGVELWKAIEESLGYQMATLPPATDDERAVYEAMGRPTTTQRP